MSSRRVLVFAKAPQPGFAKTRLIPLLGAQGAAALHARLIKHTLQTAKRAAVGAVELHGAPADDDFLRYCAERYDVQLVGQSDGDLGDRMCAALERVLSACASAVLIGSDCPALTARYLRRAALVLDDGNDAVLAPTEDGGYALIGVRRCDERLFQRIAWSTPDVMSETRERLRTLGWRWCELATLWDVDCPADYERLRESGLLERGRTRAGTV
jgi:rSAM/selenodomain-associated transferase 1